MRAAWTAFALLVLLPPPHGVRADPPVREAAPGDAVALFVGLLDHEDPALRRAAHASLRRRGPEVLASLPAEGAARSAEQRRALRLLRSEVVEDWGRARTPEGMVYVPAGPVHLPADEGRQRDRRDPGPGVRTWMRAFYLDRTEVTVGAWRAWRAGHALLGETDAPSAAEDPSASVPDAFPVTGVSRESAGRFAREVRGGHLPTLEEYLRAMRGAGTATWPWGPRFLNHRAHLAGDGREAGPLPVGSLPAGAGPFGVLDLIGNVAEWSDSASSERPRGEALVWGGSWATPPDVSIAWGRRERWMHRGFGRAPSPEIGFRVARAVDPLPGKDAAGPGAEDAADGR